MTDTNIKGLPAGRNYFTELGYSQSYPWVEVARTAKTVTVAKVNVDRDPDWKPETIPGGFAAHCVNQHEQTWLFAGFDYSRKRVLRLCKGRRHGAKQDWMHRGSIFVEGRAREFYDYNF